MQRISDVIRELEAIRDAKGDLEIVVSTEDDNYPRITLFTEQVMGDPDPKGFADYAIIWGRPAKAK